MSDSPDRAFIRPYRCYDCGSGTGFSSRRRTFAERFFLPLFLLKPVRCGECFRRDYRRIWTPVRDRVPEKARVMPHARQASSNRNVA
jgi:hypothetical protein